MFAQVKISISDQIYQSASPALHIGRIFGLFPVSISKQGNCVYLQTSPIFAFYSFLLATLLTVFAYRGLLEDSTCDRLSSIKIRSDTDVYVGFCDTSSLQLVMLFGIFLGGYKLSNFFAFVQCITEIDGIICEDSSSTKSARKMSVLMVGVMLLATISISVVDVYMDIKTIEDGGDKSKIFTRYLPLHITTCIVVMTQCKTWNLKMFILRRFERLNRYLNNTIDNIEEVNMFTNKTIAIPRVPKKVKQNFGRHFDVVPKPNDKEKLNESEVSGHIPRMMTAYIKLCDAIDLVNETSALTNAVTVLDILWHFIITPYRFLIELTGPRKDILYMLIMITWCCFHISRLLILVEPCNSCKLEVEKTNILASKLLCLDIITYEIRSQLEAFSTVLAQCKPEFSASGLTNIDRSLITALLSMVGTYLVVLLQFQIN